jgi:hypothetical protein
MKKKIYVLNPEHDGRSLFKRLSENPIIVWGIATVIVLYFIFGILPDPGPLY